MTIAIRDSNRYGRLSERRLARLEKRLGARLPDDYRSFMLEHNGGRPELQRFVFRRDGEQEESILECFFPIHDKPYRDSSRPEVYLGQPLDSVLADFGRELPDLGVLPVGRDPCANLICLGYAGSKAGRVFFYDHDEEALYPLARSFGRFLAGLTAAAPEEPGDGDEGEAALDGLDLEEHGIKQWRLKDGTRFSCWAGGDLKAGRKIAIWTTIPSGPIECRVRRGARRIIRDWARMRKQPDGGDGLPTFRASVVLEAGKYAIDFRTRDEVFSALPLTVE